MEKKVIYYSDPLNDDFAVKVQTGYTTPAKFKYIKKRPFGFVSAIVYHLLALPIAFFAAKLVHGVKIYGKKNLKKIKSGYFIYSNHTTSLDPFYAAIASHPRRSYFIANPVISRYLGMKNIIRMVGGLPLPSTISQTKDFIKFQRQIIKKRGAIVIYPEAHIWEYYNGIRPFTDASFKYPVKLDAPIVVFTTIFRRPKKEGKKPKVSVYISEPIYPDKNIDASLRHTDLRNKAYNIMCENTKKYDSYEYIKYVYKKETND